MKKNQTEIQRTQRFALVVQRMIVNAAFIPGVWIVDPYWVSLKTLSVM